MKAELLVYVTLYMQVWAVFADKSIYINISDALTTSYLIKHDSMSPKEDIKHNFQNKGELQNDANHKYASNFQASSHIYKLRIHGGSVDLIKKPKKTVRKNISLFIPIFISMAYVTSMALVIPVFPKVVNQIVSGGEGVTAESASLNGIVQGIDALFTFLTVNAAGSLSDKFGRKPFMCMASLGLGMGFFLASQAKQVWLLFVAAVVDGCTSCMYPIANAYVTDITEPENLAERLGIFQGVAFGLSFMIGFPLSGIIAHKTHIRMPLYIATGICLLNAVATLFIPEPVAKEARATKKVDLAATNPLGAAKVLGRNPLMTLMAVSYFLVWTAHASLQINWVNFTQYKFSWGPMENSMSLSLMGAVAAIAPKILVPFLRTRRSIYVGVLLMALANLLVTFVPQGWMIYPSLCVLSLGSIALPSILGFLTRQVDASETGLIQGAADTVKTLTTTFATLVSSSLFGYFIRESSQFKFPETVFFIGSVLLVLAYGLATIAVERFGHYSPHPVKHM